ncbi:MAG: hypothetical protein AAGK14_09100 [Verrucomicrobiota bacterium]
MPVIRSGQHHPRDFWVLLLRFTFRALGVAALGFGILFFVVGVGFFGTGVDEGKADVFILGLPYCAFGLVGLWVAWRLLLYLEPQDVRQVIQLICFGLFVMMLINLFSAWMRGGSMTWPLITYALGAAALWVIARNLPAVFIGILYPKMNGPQ